MNPRKPGLVFTKRHQALIHYLFRNKVATYKQIHEDLFADVKKSVVSRHLGKLLKDKRVTKSLFSLKGKFTQTYALDERSADFLDFCNQEEMARHQIQSGTVEHDLHLVDLRRRFIKSPSVLAYHSENEMQCLPEYRKDLRFAPFIELKSDAVIEVPLKKGPTLVPVELELSQKVMSRYEEKISDYYKWPEIRGVLFISGTRGIEEMVRHCEQEKKAEGSSKFFFTSLQEVMAAEKEVTFTSISGEKFILK